MNCTEQTTDWKKTSRVRICLRGHAASFLVSGIGLAAVCWFEVIVTYLIFESLRVPDPFVFLQSGSIGFVAGVAGYALLWVTEQVIRFVSVRLGRVPQSGAGVLIFWERAVLGSGNRLPFWTSVLAFLFGAIVVVLGRHMASEVPSLARLTVAFVYSATIAIGIAAAFMSLRLLAYLRKSQVPRIMLVVCIFAALFFLYFDVPRFAPLRPALPSTLAGAGILMWLNWAVRPRISIGDRLSFGICVVLIAGAAIGARAHSERPAASWWLNYNPFGFGLWTVLDLAHDIDADGYGSLFGGADCAPLDSSVYPGALEIVGDGIDNNCAGGDLKSFENLEFTGALNYELSAPPRNIVLIAIDTLRLDAFRTVQSQGELGSIETFLSESIRFDAALTTATHTNEAMPSLMAGVYPISWHQLGVNYGIEPTMAEVLRSVGYTTEAVVALPYVDHVTFRGFERVDNELGGKVVSDNRSIIDPEVTERAVERLKNLKDGPFFLWVHYFDPHGDYVAPEAGQNASLSVRSRYLAEVRRTSLQVSSLLDELDELGLYEDSIIILTSDHGEGLGDHRVATHAMSSFQSTLKVPLAMRVPGIPATRIQKNATLVDVLPTVFDALGIVGQHASDGQSWLGDVRSDRPIFFESSYFIAEPALNRGVVREDMKLTWDLRRNTFSLFDVKRDPAEVNNLVAVESELFEELNGVLGRHFDENFNDRALKAKSQVWEHRKPTTPNIYLGESDR